jgi:hypothetical protein
VDHTGEINHVALSNEEGEVVQHLGDALVALFANIERIVAQVVLHWWRSGRHFRRRIGSAEDLCKNEEQALLASASFLFKKFAISRRDHADCFVAPFLSHVQLRSANHWIEEFICYRVVPVEQ